MALHKKQILPVVFCDLEREALYLCLMVIVKEKQQWSNFMD